MITIMMIIVIVFLLFIYLFIYLFFLYFILLYFWYYLFITERSSNQSMYNLFLYHKGKRQQNLKDLFEHYEAEK